MTPRCTCGLPLHYSDATIEAFVRLTIGQYGPTVCVATPAGAWQVPRHFYALHGLGRAAADLPRLACRYGWMKQAA